MDKLSSKFSKLGKDLKEKVKVDKQLGRIQRLGESVACEFDERFSLMSSADVDAMQMRTTLTTVSYSC